MLGPDEFPDSWKRSFIASPKGAGGMDDARCNASSIDIVGASPTAFGITLDLSGKSVVSVSRPDGCVAAIRRRRIIGAALRASREPEC